MEGKFQQMKSFFNKNIEFSFFLMKTLNQSQDFELISTIASCFDFSTFKSLLQNVLETDETIGSLPQLFRQQGFLLSYLQPILEIYATEFLEKTVGNIFKKIESGKKLPNIIDYAIKRIDRKLHLFPSALKDLIHQVFTFVHLLFPETAPEEVKTIVVGNLIFLRMISLAFVQNTAGSIKLSKTGDSILIGQILHRIAIGMPFLDESQNSKFNPLILRSIDSFQKTVHKFCLPSLAILNFEEKKLTIEKLHPQRLSRLKGRMNASFFLPYFSTLTQKLPSQEGGEGPSLEVWEEMAAPYLFCSYIKELVKERGE